jgi:phenylalanyl-tRNA synthetase beta chain
MKFSEKWLREWVNPEIDTQKLVHQVTMAGLEVDGVEQVAGSFTGVVVGHVLSVEKHPDAEKLSVCRVTNGQDEFQVVCGAPNVRANLKVPFAMIGAVLPGDFAIKKAKLRGVESMGMLCAEAELGLSDASDGLMELSADAPVGKSLREYLVLDDVVIEVDLTPNRSDCLCIAGLAREVAVLNRKELKSVKIAAHEAVVKDTFPVTLSAPDACPKYVGRVIRDINPEAETPVWMKEKLRRSGVRSIDPVVDVTNYVMIELGQPMHAFDLDKLDGKIDVRMAKLGEKLTLLDGQEVALRSDTLVIADKGKALAMAGIMGGQGSGVSSLTRNIFLESAFFAPLALAGKARSYGLHTDSSHRFERGVDYKLQAKAVERATELLLSIVGGKPGPTVELVEKQHLPARSLVELRFSKVASLLGLNIPQKEVEEILVRLGLKIEKLTKDGLLIKVPSYRFDISIEVDLIEEIGRVYGYNNLPVTKPMARIGLREKPETIVSKARLADHLISLGYQEAVTYSFVDPAVQKVLNPEAGVVTLANPISSDMADMRTTLWSGLVKAVEHNQKRQQSRIRFFETGLRFVQTKEGILQEPMLAGVACGMREKERWANAKVPVDFYDVKADIESLLELVSSDFEFIAGNHPALHPGQTAQILKSGKPVGWIGLIHPAAQKTLDLNGSVYLFELCLKEITQGNLPKFKEFSKFPEVRRDLAIIVNNRVSFSDVRKTIIGNAGQFLTNVTVFDVYQGKGIDPEHKSLAVGLTWQHATRTLNDEEIAETFDSVVKALKENLDATLRS